MQAIEAEKRRGSECTDTKNWTDREEEKEERVLAEASKEREASVA